MFFSKINPTFASQNEGYTSVEQGEMAEWSNAAVLKTVDLHGSGGSNPSLSARKKQVKDSDLFEGFYLLFLLQGVQLQCSLYKKKKR